MKRKMLGALLALTLLLGIPAQAADGAQLVVSAPESLPAVGETFTVEVRIADNPGFCAAQFTLAFDTSVVDCQSVKPGSVLSGTLSASNPDAADGAMVAAVSADTIAKDGVVGVYTFRVLKSGDPDFALKDGLFSDAAGKDVAVTVTAPAGSSGTPSAPQETPETPNGTETPETPETPKTPDAETPEDAPQPEAPEESAGAVRFTDVPPGFWSYEQIRRAVELGVIGGYADGTFRPNASVTRAQFVAMLWRLAGRPAAFAPAPFADTASLNADFRAAIAWAAENGIVGGVTPTEFRPSAAINRQQAMAILFRYSGGVSGMEVLMSEVYDAQFSDSGSISASLKPGVYWALYHGIIGGVSETRLAPRNTATRAQIAVILMRYADRML